MTTRLHKMLGYWFETHPLCPKRPQAHNSLSQNAPTAHPGIVKQLMLCHDAPIIYKHAPEPGNIHAYPCTARSASTQQCTAGGDIHTAVNNALPICVSNSQVSVGYYCQCTLEVLGKSSCTLNMELRELFTLQDEKCSKLQLPIPSATHPPKMLNSKTPQDSTEKAVRANQVGLQLERNCRIRSHRGTLGGRTHCE